MGGEGDGAVGKGGSSGEVGAVGGDESALSSSSVSGASDDADDDTDVCWSTRGVEEGELGGGVGGVMGIDSPLAADDGETVGDAGRGRTTVGPNET